MEKVMIDHPFHEHSLILKKSVGNEESVDCYVCWFRIGNGKVYTCVQGKQCRSSSSEIIFHKRCGELPTQISLPSIHRHPLYLVNSLAIFFKTCNVCRLRVYRELGYRCSRCSFYVHVRCKEKVENESPRESTQLKHHCHAHPLSLLRMPPSLFSCDGCGTEDHDMAYACTTCGFLVHKTCALLPPLLPTTHHPHQLSLSSTLSLQFRCSSIACNLCFGRFDLVSWVYHCSDCRFFAHLRCVTSVLEFPLEERDVYNKLIRPFLILELNKILGVRDITKEDHSLLFNFAHMHTLSFVSDEKEEDEEEEYDDDDDGVKRKICDMCATLVSSPLYYECAQCKYFVHSFCYSPTKTLSSLQSQLYGDCPKTDEAHNFTASKGKEHSISLRCDICGSSTNGMVYGCEECGMKMDVKCASLPTAIEHASHPDHKLVKKRVVQRSEHHCHACGDDVNRKIAYCCTGDICDFTMCPKCGVLPKSVMKREWDEHQVPLTYGASIDHHTKFYCEICEEEMPPKKWMYHCRPCNNSFHLGCILEA